MSIYTESSPRKPRCFKKYPNRTQKWYHTQNLPQTPCTTSPSSSLIHRLLSLLILLRRRPLSPTLILRLHRYSPSCSLPSINLTLHIRPELDILIKVANVAADVVVRFEAEGYYGDEAELGGMCVSAGWEGMGEGGRFTVNHCQRL